jgi:hypothetical protein
MTDLETLKSAATIMRSRGRHRYAEALEREADAVREHNEAAYAVIDRLTAEAVK